MKTDPIATTSRTDRVAPAPPYGPPIQSASTSRPTARPPPPRRAPPAARDGPADPERLDPPPARLGFLAPIDPRRDPQPPLGRLARAERSSEQRVVADQVGPHLAPRQPGQIEPPQ